jgi:transglutaminase-like putative cysteine protease
MRSLPIRPRVVRCSLVAIAAVVTAPASAAPPRSAAAGAVPAERSGFAGRWTAATPDAMADLALDRARAGGADALAGLLVAASLEDRASAGRVRAGFAAIAASASPLADDARWLALRAAPEPGLAWPGHAKLVYDGPADARGLVRSFAILGPFRDTAGDGLTRREGPEAPDQSFSDVSARYSWGAYDVAWRRTLPSVATARGLPLDLYIHPRTESCTYLGSKISLAAGARAALIHVAASGSVRLLWDGATVATSDETMPELVVDRLSVRVETAPGDHLVALKVCSSSTADDGRVRVRFTDEAHRPLSVMSSSDLRSLKPAPQGKDAPSTTVVATRVATALEQALGASGSDATGRLIASVARTLGGADNARSPRAPGLLDTLARDPALSADMLAMAGWVSPFGANRSGWLNLALTKATAAGDHETESFALRRLAAAHLSAKMLDWALATTQREPLGSARDAEARLLRALVWKLGGPGLAQAALEDLEALSTELGDATPVSVWAEIVELAASQPATRLQAATRLAELSAAARGPAYVRAFRAQGGGALEVAAAGALAEQASAADLLQIGRELLDAGRYAWAREVFSYATDVAPNHAQGFQGLTTARAALLALSGEPALERGWALPALARAVDLAPGQASLKAELAFRAATPTGASAAAAAPTPEQRATPNARDERYLAPPTVFLARAKAQPAKPGEVVDRQLHWLRAVTLHPDKRVSQLMHYAREIVIEPRTDEDLVERQIPAEGDRTELLFARVHRRDGRVEPPVEQSTNGSVPSVRWPELHAGDIVEIAVRSWTAAPVGRRGDAPFYFIDYVGSIDTRPILYNEVVVDSPSDAPLAIDILHGKPDRIEDDSAAGRAIARYVWDRPPNIPDEPLAPAMSESLPVVVGSTFKSWHEFREWYRAAVRGFTEPDDQVRRIAAELTKGKKTREDKIRALFEFVADDIRYVNYVSGEWWLPNRPQELLARRQGDCDDKAILLIALLKSVGIDATEVLVQTRYTGQPLLLGSTKAAIPMFDHGIAYVPGQHGKPGLWLDATSPQSRLGPLPSMDARARALFIDEGPAVIRETPSSSPDEHGTTAAWTVKLDGSGAGELTAIERQTGDAAFELRTNLQQEDARSQWVEQSLANGWFPTVQVKPGVQFKSDLAHGATELRYEAHSDGFARREGDELAVPISETATLASQLAPLVTRTLPVVLPPRLAPGHQTVTFTIVAPPGYSFAALPPGGSEDGGPFGRARLEFARATSQKNAVVVKRSVVFDMSTIPVDQYTKWRTWLQRTDGLMRRMVRLVPDAKAVHVAEGTR